VSAESRAARFGPEDSRLGNGPPASRLGTRTRNEQDGTVTLKFARLAGDTWPAGGPLRIRAGIDFPVTLLPDGRHLVFQVTRGPETERGLYLFALPAAP
jgi:hypothetical protein